MKWNERVDNLVGLFSPERAFKRKRFRALAEIVEHTKRRQLSAWEAADSTTQRKGSWVSSRLGMDADLNNDLATLRERSREAAKNDPYAVSFVEATTTNTVGREIRVQSRMKAIEGDGVLTEESIKNWNTELEEAWRRQSERIGVNGESLHEIEQLAMRHWAIDGEIIILVSAVSEADRPVPLAVQVVDPARLETPPEEFSNPNISLGVERNSRGQVIAYHFRKGVIGDGLRETFAYERITADRVCHIFTKYHADQTRGYPPLSPSLGSLKDRRDLHDAVIMLEQVSACFGLVIKTPNPMGMAEGRATLTNSRGEPVEELSPGGVTYIQQGSDVTTASPGSTGANVGVFTESILRAASAGANTPYELLGKDYSRTTYSSGRLSLIDGRLNYEMLQKALVKGFLKPLWSLFVKQMVDFGETTIDSRDYNRRPWMYARGQWMLPGWPWIDPVKEVQASQMAMESNLMTLADALAERGVDLDEHLEQLWKEKQKLEEFELLPPEPEPAKPGQPQPAKQPKQKQQMAALEHRVAELEELVERMAVAQ
jgi:lambda family phage portal protein